MFEKTTVGEDVWITGVIAVPFVIVPVRVNTQPDTRLSPASWMPLPF